MQEGFRKSSQGDKGTKDRAAIYGSCTFGSLEDSALLRKALDMAKVNAAIQARSRVQGVLQIPKEAAFPTVQRMNMYTHSKFMTKCIEHDSVVPNVACKPGKFVNDAALNLAVLRLQHLARKEDLLRDLGVPGISVPTVDLLRTMNKAEYHLYMTLAMYPFDGVETEESFKSCYISQERSLGFYAGEEIGPADKDRIENLIKQKYEFTMALMCDSYHQYAKRPDGEGNLKQMPNWPGIFYNKEQPMNDGMNKVFYSGVAFPQPRLGDDGKPDPKQRTMARAIALDVQKTFVPSIHVKGLGKDWAHDLGLAFQCFEDFNENRKLKTSFDGVFDPLESSSVPMMHQDVAKNKNHPGRLELQPSSRSQSAPPRQSADQSMQPAWKRSSPFGSRGAVSTDKLEQAWNDMGAQSRGEAPKNPGFWTRRNEALPKKLERTGLMHMMAELRDDVDARLKALEQFEQAEDKRVMLADDDGYETAASGSDVQDFRREDEEDEEYDDGDGVVDQEPQRDTRMFYEDVKMDVMQHLSNMDSTLLRKMPTSVQERVNEFRVDRDTREREQRNRDANRNDAPLWQKDRNSANNNPGRLQEGKRVAFAGGAFAKGACLRHQRNMCQHADNPQNCQWSHDPDVCFADADIVTAVAASRRAAAQKTRKPAEKVAVVAKMGANNRQTTEQKQSSGTSRAHFGPELDNQQEE